MGKYYAGYQLFQVLEAGVGPSKIIWQWDGSRRVFYLDYGSESLRGETYINSGPSLGEYTKFIPNRPLELRSYSRNFSYVCSSIIFNKS